MTGQLGRKCDEAVEAASRSEQSLEALAAEGIYLHFAGSPA